MLKTPYVLPAVTRGFTDYFRLNIDIEELATAFGYTYRKRRLTLPEVADTPDWVETLQTQLQTMIERVIFSKEASKREVLVAPIFVELVTRMNVKMQMEHSIRVSDNLHGTLDYLLSQKDNLLVVEAKHGDSTRGMRQLLAEMVALDQIIAAQTSNLWGALTLGETWQFVVLSRADKIWTQDTAIIPIPDGLPFLARVLTAILTGVAPQLSPTRP